MSALSFRILRAAVLLAEPHVDRRLRTLGQEPTAIALKDAPAFLRHSIDTWGEMIRATGISAD